MKRNFIPATIVALAISLTAVVAPQATADNEPITTNQAAEADVRLRAGDSVPFSPEDLLEAIGHGPTGDSAPTITSVNTSIQGGTGPFGYDWSGTQLTVDAGSKPGVYDLAVELTTSDPGGETLEGTLTIEVIGAGLSGSAKVLDATDEPQSTGLTLTNPSDSSKVIVTDAEDKTIEPTVSDTGEITVAPGANAVSPLMVTVTDDSLAAPLTKSIPLRVTATVSPDNYVAKADGKRWVSGVTLTQATAATKISAVDEDGTTVKHEVESDGVIMLITTTDIDGPITLTVTDPTLQGGSKSFTITVVDHEKGVDDNGADGDDDGAETEEISVSGSARELIANGESQFTGLTLVNATEDTSVTAEDKDGSTVAWSVATDGKISVTPKADTVSPITITVTDESLDDAITKEVTVKVPSADDAPLSSGIGDFGLIALGAVLAAVLGIIGAISTGVLQLPF